MEKIITKEKAQELMKINAKTRAALPKSYGLFILKEEGEEGLKRLEERMAELGYPTNFKKMNTTIWLPAGIEPVILLAIKELFNYEDEKFNEIGEFHPKTSPPIFKIFLKFVDDVEVVASQGPAMWEKQYSKGEFEVPEVNKEKKYVVARIKQFRLHPLCCRILGGYYHQGLKMIVKRSGTSWEETKCPFRGDKWHEYILRW